jgi:hypothetical protein
VTLVVLTLLVNAGGCSDDSASTGVAAPGAPELPGPGTEIGAGFTVPDGALLLGVFPTENDVRGEDGPVEAWMADLFITGDARQVVEDLDHQTVEAGRTVAATCESGLSLGEARCQLYSRRVVDGFQVEWVFGNLVQVATEDHYASHLRIDYARWAEGVFPDEGPLAQLGRQLDEMPATPAPPLVPTEGEPVAERQYGPRANPITVAEGVDVLAPVRTFDDCTGSFLAHLEVTGDVDEVVDVYRSQFRSFWGRATDDQRYDEWEFRGRRAIRLFSHVSGGGDLTLDVVVGDGHVPTLARLHRCGD